MALKFRFPNIPNVRCLFGGKKASFCEPGGNISFKSGDEHSVAQARHQLMSFCEKRGMTGWAECNQRHGTNIHVSNEPTNIMAKAEELPSADGMMTDRPGLGLMIKTADCQPLLLAHKSGRHIMALHVGWRGNRACFPQLGVEAFCSAYDLKPEDLMAVRGPSLGPTHARFTDFASEWGQDFRSWYDESKMTMDLWALTKSQLVQSGIKTRNIFEFSICTYASNEAWFSWRRRQTGRQAALIWIAANQGEHP